ncbi:MAG TPA: DUF5926 family protein [Marmoricola sp.]
MGKKARVKARSVETTRTEGEVGPRQPCPCGSGRRYKSCHGSPGGPPVAWSARPFAGLGGECDLIAMREFVPAATAPLRLDGSDRDVLLCTLLPGAAPALVRESGAIWLGLQVQHAYGDPSRDLAAVLGAALEAEPGAVVGLTRAPGDGPRLQDLVTDGFDVTVHDGFGFWLDDLAEEDRSSAAALEEADLAAAPTARLDGVDAAYWTAMGEREFLRWVRPEDEDPLLDALARLHTAREDHLVDGARLIGMFRAHGVLTPVWDLPPGTGSDALTGPAAAFDRRLAETLADARPLHTAERAARSGLASRQVTLH